MLENLEYNSYLAAVPNYFKMFYQNKIFPGTQQFLVSVSIRYLVYKYKIYQLFTEDNKVGSR